PRKVVLRLRARLLPAKPPEDRGRRDHHDQGIDRALAHPDRDLLLREGAPGPSPAQGEQSAGRLNPDAQCPEGIVPMRIAQVAPLFESVPPKQYGGTERVVSYLTEELVRQGHDVTLFASGDSQTSARLVAGSPCALWQEPDCREQLPHHVRLVE